MAKKLARKKAPEPEPEPEKLVDFEVNDDELLPNVEPILYNTDDACFMLGRISKPMLFRLITKKKLHPVKLGSRSMFTRQELERYVRECEVESQTG